MRISIAIKHLLFIKLVVIICINCQAQNWQWAVKLNSGTNAYDLAVDNSGYAYIATGNNTNIQKFNPQGKLIWSKSGAPTSYSKGLTFDQNNNLYVAGHGYNEVWDGQKTNHIRPATGLCLFVMKLDTSGKLIWSTTIPKMSSFAAFRIVADTKGATYIHGALDTYFSFVTKLNPDGTEAWYKKLSGQNYAAGHGDIGLDNTGNCFVTSDYGTSWYPQSTLIAKFDNAGNQLWVKTINECTARGIDVKPNGDFLLAANGGNYCTGKYNNSGELIWNSNTVIMHGTDILSDYQNNFYGVGNNNSSLSFPVIAKWDERGNPVWNINLPCSGNSYADVIKSTRIDSYCYVAGNFTSSITMDGTVLESASQSVYLGKLNCNFSVSPSDKIISKIYPNPFTQKAILDFEYIENEVYTLKIFDIHGQLVKSIENITNGLVTIQRDNLTSGVYFYSLNCKSRKVESAKFIIY